MCTSIIEIARAEGMAKRGDDWFPLSQAVVAYDHARHALLGDVITLDFINTGLDPGARAGVELTLETAQRAARRPRPGDRRRRVRRGGSERQGRRPSASSGRRDARRHQRREIRVVLGVRGGRLAAAQQISERLDETGDRPNRAFVPADIERREPGKELQPAVGQMVVDPIGHRPPVGALGIAVGEPGHDDAGGRPAESGSVAPVPDVAAVVPSRSRRSCGRARCRAHSPRAIDRLTGSRSGRMSR